MKKSKNIYTVLVIILFAGLFAGSGGVKNYYQVYNAVNENGTLVDNNIVFEDNNCKIVYNLFADGGDFGFTIYNKTLGDIVLNVDKSYFVINGLVYDYYQNRVFTTTNTNKIPVQVSSSGVKKTYVTTTTENTVDTPEQATLTIPANTHRNINGYQLISRLYSTCELLKYPNPADVKALTFTKANSPFVFYNIISYTAGGVSRTVENNFYISQITNLPEKMMLTKFKTTNCPDETGPFSPKSIDIYVFKDASPNSFFFKYTNAATDPRNAGISNKH
jgi:hypothetical protein